MATGRAGRSDIERSSLETVAYFTNGAKLTAVDDNRLGSDKNELRSFRVLPLCYDKSLVVSISYVLSRRELPKLIKNCAECHFPTRNFSPVRNVCARVIRARRGAILLGHESSPIRPSMGVNGACPTAARNPRSPAPLCDLRCLAISGVARRVRQSASSSLRCSAMRKIS